MDTHSKPLSRRNCYIVSPMTSSVHAADSCLHAVEYFEHVTRPMLEPAIQKAGYDLASASLKNLGVLHEESMQALQNCDLVLIDLTVLNPRVAFEFGASAALGKPVCFVQEQGKTDVPLADFFCKVHTYLNNIGSPLFAKEVEALARHIADVSAHWTLKSGLISAKEVPPSTWIGEGKRRVYLKADEGGTAGSPIKAKLFVCEMDDEVEAEALIRFAIKLVEETSRIDFEYLREGCKVHFSVLGMADRIGYFHHKVTGQMLQMAKERGV